MPSILNTVFFSLDGSRFNNPCCLFQGQAQNSNLQAFFFFFLGPRFSIIPRFLVSIFSKEDFTSPTVALIVDRVLILCTLFHFVFFGKFLKFFCHSLNLNNWVSVLFPPLVGSWDFYGIQLFCYKFVTLCSVVFVIWGSEFL